MNIFKLAALAAGALIAAGLIMNWSDLKRYVKIERM
jgi:hypothetical protein